MLSKNLKPEDIAFRKLVTELNGHQTKIAQALGIDQRSVTARLRSEKHASWWVAFKATRSRKRRQGRAQRSYAQQKARHEHAQADMQDPAGAAERALARAALESL